MRILMVDDEPDIVDSLSKVLEKNGFEVDAYYDPEKVLADLPQKTKYDLAILDISMPKMNGFQLYRELIKSDKIERIFFISAFEQYHEEFNKAFPELDKTRFIKNQFQLINYYYILQKTVSTKLVMICRLSKRLTESINS